MRVTRSLMLWIAAGRWRQGMCAAAHDAAFRWRPRRAPRHRQCDLRPRPAYGAAAAPASYGTGAARGYSLLRACLRDERCRFFTRSPSSFMRLAGRLMPLPRRTDLPRWLPRRPMHLLPRRLTRWLPRQPMRLPPRRLTRWRLAPATRRIRAGRDDQGTDRKHDIRRPGRGGARLLFLWAFASYGPSAQWAYTLDSGDRLRIVIFGQDGLTNSYVARCQRPYPDAADRIGAGARLDHRPAYRADRRNARQGFIREPHVAVEIEAYRPFFILGEVTQPGQYPYVANMTVETLVAIAGGFGPRAERKQITISRNMGGQVYRFATPVTAPIQPGDTIQVQERWF